MIWQDVNVVLEEEVLNNARNVGACIVLLYPK
jgi:hypothetical protein